MSNLTPRCGVALSVAAALLLAACGMPAGMSMPAACDVDGDCATGEVCVSHACMPASGAPPDLAGSSSTDGGTDGGTDGALGDGPRGDGGMTGADLAGQRAADLSGVASDLSTDHAGDGGGVDQGALDLAGHLGAVDLGARDLAGNAGADGGVAAQPDLASGNGGQPDLSTENAAPDLAMGMIAADLSTGNGASDLAMGGAGDDLAAMGAGSPDLGGGAAVDLSMEAQGGDGGTRGAGDGGGNGRADGGGDGGADLAMVAMCAPWTGDCDNNPANGCETNLASPDSCGMCGRVCSTQHMASRACMAGVCTGTCAAGYADCDGNLALDGCETDLGSPDSCGACGRVCSKQHVDARGCSGGACTGTCSAGFADCDGDLATNGCETDLSAITSCGGCGVTCSTNHVAPSCIAGTCTGTCAPGFADCDGDLATNGCEVDLSTTASCGACGRRCSMVNVTPTCQGGACTGTCDPLFFDCDNDLAGTGCETNGATDPKNCGGCHLACSTSHVVSGGCSGGACVGTCAAPFADCDHDLRTDGCEIDTSSDVANCGGCGTTCAAASLCCDGACRDPKSDPVACGGCGVVCPLPAHARAATCSSGACGFTCEDGYGDCNGIAADGCETPVGSDATMCGGCGMACGTAHVTAADCFGARCDGTCAAGTWDCDDDGGDGCEATFATDGRNCGACGVACAAGTSCVMGGCAPGLVAAPTTLVFADTKINNSSTAMLTLSNPTAATLSVALLSLPNVGNDGADFSIVSSPARPFTLAPNGTASITIGFRPGGGGARTGTLAITLGGNLGTIVVPLAGNGVGPNIVAPNKVFTGASTVVGTQLPPTPITIANTGYGSPSLIVSKITLSGAYASDYTLTNVPALPVTIPPGQSITIDATLTVAARVSTALLLVTSNDPIAGTLGVTLAGGDGAPALTPNITSVSFGNGGLTTTSQPVTGQLTNTGYADLHVSGATIAGADPGDFAVMTPPLPFTLSPGASATYSVVFQPAALGARGATISFASDDPGGARTVMLSGTGVAAPSLTASAGLDLGAVAVSGSALARSQIVNGGGVPVQITSLSFAQPAPAALRVTWTSQPLPYTLPPGQTLSFDVAAMPLAAGVSTGTLVVASAPSTGTTIPVQVTAQ